MGRSSFRRLAGSAGLAALFVLVLAGVAEAACGDCSAHRDSAVDHGVEAALTGGPEQAVHGQDAHGPMEGHPPCCDGGDVEEGERPDLPVCPHSAAATGCAGSGSLHAQPTDPLNDVLPVHLGLSLATDIPGSASTAPPFQPPRV